LTNFPEPSDYPISVTGNSPNPSNLAGSSSGTPVTIWAGDYTVGETLASTGALQAQLQGPSTYIITSTTAEGDCTPNFNVNTVFEDASGTMTSGGSQKCTIINTTGINNGLIPRP
jgi:hypothetical protein